ncbi:MAG: arylsulfatase [Bryobacterales bacterium]|nr:arylsulfatase [Bryobacterales bacterium]
MRLSAIVAAVSAALLVSGCLETSDRHPNIVVILADDFGVGDIQAHYPRNKIATPYLDRLASEGMSFTDAHSPSAVCTPTRYGLLTGRYSWRTRLQEWVLAAHEPPLIAPDRPTLPGVLRDHGYDTALIGKWHLGWEWAGPQPSRMTKVRNGQKTLEWDFTEPVREGPTSRGFDYYFGVDLPNMPPFSYIENETVDPVPTARYVYDSTEGVVMPRGFEGSPMAPGWRFREIVPELTKRAVQQVHDRARSDRPFFLFYSMTSPHEPVSPSQPFMGRSEIAPIADFVMETDWSAGQVIEAVDEAGIADDTIVIFTADNGHSHYTGWDELVEAGHMPSGPYRGHKGDIWEGGHRVPLLVRWPGHVEPDSSSDRLVSLTDIFATSLEVIGVDLPDAGAEDSMSFLDAMTGGDGAGSRTSLVSHSNHGEFAYRHGPWKLVYRRSGANLEESRGQPTIAELYDLRSDIAEERDLATEHPNKVDWLRRRFDELIERGASRSGIESANDAQVRYEITQTERWAPPAGERP